MAHLSRKNVTASGEARYPTIEMTAKGQTRGS